MCRESGAMGRQRRRDTGEEIVGSGTLVMQGIMYSYDIVWAVMSMNVRDV
jgi:hypothetical protein